MNTADASSDALRRVMQETPESLVFVAEFVLRMIVATFITMLVFAFQRNRLPWSRLRLMVLGIAGGLASGQITLSVAYYVYGRTQDEALGTAAGSVVALASYYAIVVSTTAERS